MVWQRIVYDPQIENPAVHIFKIDGKKWKFLFANSGDITTDARTYFETNSTGGLPLIFEFLSSGVSGDFDILKATESTSNNERTEYTKSTDYFIFEKDGGDLNDDRIEPDMLEVYSPDNYSRFYYEFYVCPLINLKVDETLPCKGANSDEAEYMNILEKEKKRKTKNKDDE
jgi:hypothetical protein